MKSISTDILIVGAGVIGSALAYHLSRKTKREVLVVDVDLEGSLSSSELNAGGVRATWNNPMNARLAKEGIDFFETVRDEIGFRQKGYFWMHKKGEWEEAASEMRKLAHLQKLGIEYLTPSEISKRFPFIDGVEDLGGATFSPKDGLLNPNLLKLHYRREAMAASRNVSFLDRVWVDGVESRGDAAITLKTKIYPQGFDDSALRTQLTSFDISAADSASISCNTLVNCTGAWANRFSKELGLPSFSNAVRRQVSLFECKGLDLSPYGMFVDASGVYFHAEAHLVLAGFAVPDEAPGYNFEYDAGAFFEEHIWAPLYERSKYFHEVKHVTGWAGLYEVSADHMPVLGLVPGCKNVFESHSFSGRGVMLSYGAGRVLADEILGEVAEYPELSVKRFLDGKTSSGRESLII